MPLDLPAPIIYLITSGATTASTTSDDCEFSDLLRLLEAAVVTEISLFQIREKNLRTRVLFELTSKAASITRDSPTRLLVNDRFDIARAAGADGVQLTSQSMPAEVIRRLCGSRFLIGVSTHSVEEVHAARNAGADLAVFGPIFHTESKRGFGTPQGVERLQKVTSEVSPFPVVAIGGISLANVDNCFRAGAAGVAAIKMLNDPDRLPVVVAEIRRRFLEHLEALA